MSSSDGLSRRSSFLLVMLIVTLSTLLGTAYMLWRLRVEAIDRHLDAAGMYARAFEDHLSNSFNVIDLTLANVAAETPSSATLAAALRHAPYLRSLAVIDRDGRVLASSEPANIGVTIARDSFLPSAATPSPLLRIGPPWLGRDFHDGRATTPQLPASAEAQTLLPVLREQTDGKGRWVTVLASVNPDYFLNYYSRSLTADPGVVELLRYDGIVLLSSDPRRASGSWLNNQTLLKRLAAEELGQLEQSADDGRAVLTAFRASRSFPLAIVVNLDRASVLNHWRREASRTAVAVLAGLLMALAVAALYFVRLERAARQHDADLEQLRLRSAALEAAANAIVITDHRGVIEWANPAFCAISGYTLAEALARNPREIIKSGVQPAARYRDLWQTIVAGKVWRGELINRRKDGSHYQEDQTITPVRDDSGAIRHFVAVKQDITERKANAQRLDELSRHLVLVQESARRRLSGELHDRTSPNLAAIGINLDIIQASLRADEAPELSARLEDVRALIEDTTASIREIGADLRPPVLDYGGLVAALESYVKQFQRRTGIAIRFDHSAGPEDPERLAPAVESVLFRIVQEALTNCAKHSRARAIVVCLEQRAGSVTLGVSDDGNGFDPAALGKTTHTSGLGILTMREMAEFSGGRFFLESAPGQGTRIVVTIKVDVCPTGELE